MLRYLSLMVVALILIASNSFGSLLASGLLTELHDPDKVYCFNKVEEACAPDSDKDNREVHQNCNSKFGGINHVLYALEELANMHIIRSYEYMMISAHFENYQINRVGFAKLFMQLSDEKWNDGINIIKYVTKRGGFMNFNTTYVAPVINEKNAYEVYELAGLAKALDFEKNLAEKVNGIHRLSTEISQNRHDAGAMEFLQDLIEKFEDNSRKLSGFVVDLVNMANSSLDRNLAFYQFDNYLSKLY